MYEGEDTMNRLILYAQELEKYFWIFNKSLNSEMAFDIEKYGCLVFINIKNWPLAFSSLNYGRGKLLIPLNLKIELTIDSIEKIKVILKLLDEDIYPERLIYYLKQLFIEFKSREYHMKDNGGNKNFLIKLAMEIQQKIDRHGKEGDNYEKYF
jgi:hypothetical protein